MRLVVLFAAAAAAVVLPGATTAATGGGRQLPPFHRVELAGSNTVTIRVGDRQSVIVNGDRKLLAQVTTEVHAGTLVIGNKPGGFTSKRGMSVDVSVPTLSAITLSGSGVMICRK